MNDPIITVENIGKSYRIGRKLMKPQTVLEGLKRIVSTPFSYLSEHFRNPLEEEILWALRGVSFEVKRGEVLGVIGRNGAGKSTLLKILSRITDPTEGRARIIGRVNSLLEVGTGFHPELTGRENIYMNAAMHGMRRDEINRKMDEIIDFAEVSKFIDTPVKRYSSGMYTRLAFGVAAHLEPDILIVDEVLAVGDMSFQKKCLGKMRVVAEAGRTVLFVSHNMSAVSALCSRLIMLDNGRIISDGSTESVISQYIASANDSRGSADWRQLATAPGDNFVRLLSVRILSEGVLSSDVPIDKPIVVEIIYENRRADAQLMCTLHLDDNVGIRVLASINAPSACLSPDPWYGKPMVPGIYRSRCTLPANFLNDGLYRVSVTISTENTNLHVNQRDVVTFQVHETGAMRKEYYGAWPGLVRPCLSWATDECRDQSNSPVKQL